MVRYIYKTTDLTNNKIYIGQHSTINPDIPYYGSGKILLRLLKKYGRIRFEVEVLFRLSECLRGLLDK